MERFAKRKVKILKGRSGQKLAFWCPDDGTKEFIGEYSKYIDNDSICEDVKMKVKLGHNRKCLYEISADCLVDFCILHWYVEADSDEDAWRKGYEIVNSTHIADSGSVVCKRIEHLPEGAKLYKEGVRPIEKEIYTDTDSVHS